MSNFEIFLIVMVCVVPILTFLMILPKVKLKKKEKKAPQQTKTYAELKAEEKPIVVEEKPIEKKENKTYFQQEDLSEVDFKNYLDHRKPISKPSKLELPNDFRDGGMPYVPRRKRIVKKQQDIAEEIQSLSPELKALIIAGVLNKRDFD